MACEGQRALAFSHKIVRFSEMTVNNSENKQENRKCIYMKIVVYRDKK